MVVPIAPRDHRERRWIKTAAAQRRRPARPRITDGRKAPDPTGGTAESRASVVRAPVPGDFCSHDRDALTVSREAEHDR
jgi:hypothetical protein